MKKREFKNLISKDVKELEKMVSEWKNEMFKTKAEVKAGKENNLKKVKNLKIDIAQVKTIIRQKQFEEEKEKVKEVKEKK